MCHKIERALRVTNRDKTCLDESVPIGTRWDLALMQLRFDDRRVVRLDDGGVNDRFFFSFFFFRYRNKLTVARNSAASAGDTGKK